MHRLLAQQTEQFFGKKIPPIPGIEGFFSSISEAYSSLEEKNRKLEEALQTTTGTASTEISNFKNAIDETSMVVMISKSGLISYTNQKFQSHTGFTKEDLQGSIISDILGGNQDDKITAAATYSKDGKTWKGEIHLKTNHEQIIWMDCTVVPILKSNGKIARFMAILIDITARKIYEEKIIDSERKYKLAVNSIREVIFQIDESMEWVFLNQAWVDITGLQIHETLGTSFYECVHPEDITKIKFLFSQLLTNKKNDCQCSIRIRTTKNQYRWFEVIARQNKLADQTITGISGTLNDVTEKRKIDELLVKSYAFQRAILDSARQAIISTDEMGVIRTFNKGAENMLGFKGDKMIGQINISHLLEELQTEENKNDQANNALNSFKKMIAESTEESAMEREHNLISNHKQMIPVMLSLTSIKDHNGMLAGFLFIANDITKRKKAEEENNKLNKILEETPDYVTYYDLNNNQLFANKAYKEIRFNNNEETQLPLHPPWVEVIIKKKAIPFAHEHGSWKGETVILDLNGEERPVMQLILIHKDEYGNPVFRSSVMRDITQRKQYEQKLLLSEKRNRDLINYSQGIICTHDLNGTILSINPAGCDVTGYYLEELVGNTIFELMPEDRKELFTSEYLKGFNSGKTSEGILTLIHKKGNHIHLLYKNYKVDEPDGTSYVIGFAQDFTERINAENELKTAKQSAEESSKAKELFLANMSHEIRTPMNGIVGLTNLLLKGELNDKQVQYAQSVKHSAENLLVIINDILDFSKIEAGKMELHKNTFELSNLLYSIDQTFQNEANQKGLILKTEMEDNLHSLVNGDEVRINQILVNLVSNAIKFTSKGKITIQITKVTETAEAIRVRFNISDTGIGIPIENQDKIFQSFTQSNSDTTRKYGGTGLGLSIVKSIVELLGGSIRVESEVDKGSHFCIELNLEKAEGLDTRNMVFEELDFSGKLDGLRILLAEDNKVNQLFAQELLSDWGAKVDIADNGRIAVDFLCKKEYDIILMDIQMPEMSGLDATRVVRNEFSEPKKSIPIIAMTANAMKGEDKKFIAAGMNAVIFKPFEAKELFDKISEQISIEIRSIPLENELILSPKTQSERNEHEPLMKHASLHILRSFSKGKSAFMVKMIQVILDSVPETLLKLETAVQQKDPININRYAHKLIPNMNMMGNLYFEKEMRWIEDHNIEQSVHPETENRFLSMQKDIEAGLEELKISLEYYKGLAEVTK